MELRRVAVGSAGYGECLELRRVILRVPLGLKWSEEDLRRENEEWQMGLWNPELEACVSVRWLGDGAVKLRQMAVRADRQGCGVGRVLVEEVIALLRKEGMHTVELHARESAVGFYERLGFAVVGERFEEVGIPHRRMERSI